MLACLSIQGADLRIGIIGLDTSHVIAFTKLLNDRCDPNHIPGARVVAAYKGGSPDMELSVSRVEKFTAEMRDRYQIRIVPDIVQLCQAVDAVLLESVDGRVHLDQVRTVLAMHKPVFIDKPLASSFRDASEIARLGRESGTPWFSASSLRFLQEFDELRRDQSVGRLLGAASFGSAQLQSANPGLFWYGIHAVEALYTVMGSGCESVSNVSNTDFDLVVGRWRDGRIGTVRGIRKGKADFGVLVFGEKAVRYAPVIDDSYLPLVRQIVRFFQTGVPPVSNEETLETIAFMDAAERSRLLGGVPVTVKTFSSPLARHGHTSERGRSEGGKGP